LWKDWSVGRTDTLFLGNHEGSFMVRKLTLVEVTGKGRKIR
jgi:hypothetical protein